MGQGSDMLLEQQGGEAETFWPSLENSQGGLDAVAESVGITTPDFTMTEVSRRIDKGKLLQSLLAHDLFQPGSASPDIIAEVQNEIRQFIVSRLEVMFGIRPEEKKAAPVEVELPFDGEQVEILKALADRALKRTQPVMQANPQVVPMAAMAPVAPVTVTPMSAPVVQQPKKPQPQQQQKAKPTPKKQPAKSASQDAGEFTKPLHEMSMEEIEALNEQRAARRRGQTVGPVKPIPQPDASTMDIIAAQHAKAATRQMAVDLAPNNPQSASNPEAIIAALSSLSVNSGN